MNHWLTVEFNTGEEVADKPAKQAETLSMQLIKIRFHTPVMYLPSLSRYLAICFPFPNFTHYWFQEPNTFDCAELLGIRIYISGVTY